MSKTSYMLIVVLSTLQCLDNGKRAVFLPSPEPQKVPKDAADDAIIKGLAKKPEKAPKKPAAKPTGETGGSPNPGSESSDASGNQTNPVGD